MSRNFTPCLTATHLRHRSAYHMWKRSYQIRVHAPVHKIPGTIESRKPNLNAVRYGNLQGGVNLELSDSVSRGKFVSTPVGSC